MIIFNPTNKPIEFRHAGRAWIILSKESRTVTETEGKAALDPRIGKGLVLYTEAHQVDEEVTDMDYDTMPWKELIKASSVRKLFRPGTKRETIVKLMRDYDEENRITQKSSN